jgi:hypothetical protein
MGCTLEPLSSLIIVIVGDEMIIVADEMIASIEDVGEDQEFRDRERSRKAVYLIIDSVYHGITSRSSGASVQESTLLLFFYSYLSAGAFPPGVCYTGTGNLYSEGGI